MSADIANWLQVNILNNPQIFQGILALIIMVIGGILWSPKKPVEKGFFKRSSGALIFVFGIFTFLYAFIANLADVFTVWATLVLAGVAVFSFEENRRLRKQYKEREERDRKETKLNRIIDWATEILECGRDPSSRQMFVEDSLQKKKDKGSILYMLGSEAHFQIIAVRALHIGYLANDIDPKLGKAVTFAKKRVEQHRKVLKLGSKLKDRAAIGRHRKKVDNAASKVIKLASKLL